MYTGYLSFGQEVGRRAGALSGVLLVCRCHAGSHASVEHGPRPGGGCQSRCAGGRSVRTRVHTPGLQHLPTVTVHTGHSDRDPVAATAASSCWPGTVTVSVTSGYCQRPFSARSHCPGLCHPPPARGHWQVRPASTGPLPVPQWHWHQPPETRLHSAPSHRSPSYAGRAAEVPWRHGRWRVCQ